MEEGADSNVEGEARGKGAGDYGRVIFIGDLSIHDLCHICVLGNSHLFTEFTNSLRMYTDVERTHDRQREGCEPV